MQAAKIEKVNLEYKYDNVKEMMCVQHKFIVLSQTCGQQLELIVGSIPCM